MVKYSTSVVDELPYFRLALFVAHRYFKMFSLCYPEDALQTAALVALEVADLDEVMAKREINRRFRKSMKEYGFGLNLLNEWYIPEVVLPSWAECHILRVHSLDRQTCSIHGCTDQPIKHYPRYGRVCRLHSERLERLRRRPEQPPGIGPKTYTCSFCKRQFRRLPCHNLYDDSLCSRRCYQDHQRETRKRDIPIHIIKEIKRHLKAGKGQRRVAKEFGLPRSTVVNIDRGRWYSEVTAE